MTSVPPQSRVRANADSFQLAWKEGSQKVDLVRVQLDSKACSSDQWERRIQISQRSYLHDRVNKMSTSLESLNQVDSDSTVSPELKNIVVLSDGTGNAGGISNGTNVWRIRQAVDSDPKSAGLEQVIIYEDGVGTSSFGPARALGGGIGVGITNDLVSLYSRLIQAYRPGDRLYLFGFSRGAFTIRLLAYMLYRCGVARVDVDGKYVDGKYVDGKLKTPEQIRRLAKDAVKSFKLRHINADRDFRREYGIASAELAAKCSPDWSKAAAEFDSDTLEGQGRVPIHFLGVWDTVDAVGLPFDNVTQLVVRILQFLTRSRLFRLFVGETLLNLVRPIPFFREKGVDGEPVCNEWKSWGADDDLHPCIENAFHAMAVDDERKTFHPVLWLEFTSKKDKDEYKPDRPDTLLVRVEQVWFAGAHANVGGGYPKDHLAHVPLQWMMLHARQAGLRFDKQTWSEYQHRRDELGKLYDSRGGGGVFYRYKPRSILGISRDVGIYGDGDDIRKPRLHRAVLQRIEQSTSSYAPYGAPEPDRYIEVPDPELPKEWFDVPKPLKELISPSEHACPEADHYERRWSSEETWDAQSEARRTSHTQAVRLSDLRLCCYYALCIWAVTFLTVGGIFAPTDTTSASPGLNDFANTSTVNQVAEQIGASFDLLYGEQLGPVFTPLTLGALAIPGTLWVIILALTLVVLLVVVLVAFLKGGMTILTGRSTETSQSGRSPGVFRVVAMSAIVAFFACLLQPLVKDAFLIVTPEPVEEVIRGVVDCRGLVAFFGFAMATIFQVSRICKRRIREWGVYGWKTSLLVEHPIKPDHTIWERLGATFPSNSFQGRFLERIALPVCAITLVIVAAAAFIVSAVSAVAST